MWSHQSSSRAVWASFSHTYGEQARRGMRGAPLLDMKSLSFLFLSTIPALGCATQQRAPEPPASPSASAPPAASAGASTHAMHHGNPGNADTANGPGTDASAPLGVAIDPGASAPVPVTEAVAILVPTKGSRVSGVVHFRHYGPGTEMEVTASVEGLPPGPHAYHVHVFGDCSSPDAKSAGPHFHFVGSSFGEQPGFITGNLGELRGDGKPTTDRGRIHAELQGRYSIIGRSVVIHELGNNPASPPDGAAGKRIACGVIGVAGPAPAAPATAHR